MNIYNVLSDCYYHSLTFLQEYCDYSKETKVKRLLNFSEFLNKFMYIYTNDHNKIGNIFLTIHIIGIITLISLYVFIPVNLFTFGLVFSLGMVQIFVNKYFGQNGCILTRLERLYFDNKNWFGPVTFIVLFFNKEPTRFNVDLLIVIGSINVILYYIYKIYKSDLYKIYILHFISLYNKYFINNDNNNRINDSNIN